MRDLFKFLESRIEDLEAAVSNRPMFGPGSLNGKLLRPKSVVSAMINVDELEAVNANTGDLSVSGTITIGSGGSIVDADGSTWDQSGLTLKAVGAIGDVLQFEVGATPKVTQVYYSDLGAGDSLFTIRNFEDFPAWESSSTTTNSSALVLRVDDVTAGNNYALLSGVGPSVAGEVYAQGDGSVSIYGSGNRLASFVSTNRAFTSLGRIYPGDGTSTENTTMYFDINTTPSPDRVRLTGGVLETPGLWVETTTSLATYFTFQSGSNPAVTFEVDGQNGTNPDYGTTLYIRTDHTSTGRESYLYLDGTTFALEGHFNANDYVNVGVGTLSDTQQLLQLFANNNTNSNTGVYISANDTATSSAVYIIRNGTEIVRFNGDANTDTTLGALVGQIPVRIAGGATQYYIPYYAA